jgi:hypothetical protein
MLHKCSKCIYITTLKSNLTRHCVRKHCIYENIGINNCENIEEECCNLKINGENPKNLCENLKNECENLKNISTLFQCIKCSKFLSTNISLKKHQNICKGVKNALECPSCHNIFASRQSKSYHLKSCIPPPPAPSSLPSQEPYKKKQIPQSVRIAVWDTYIGRSIGETRCTVCNNSKISQFNFHCGHIIAEKNGGTISIENLRPICKSCNSSMRTTNLEEFKQYYFNAN